MVETRALCAPPVIILTPAGQCDQLHSHSMDPAAPSTVDEWARGCGVRGVSMGSGEAGCRLRAGVFHVRPARVGRRY
jgi:hypothetical protein